MKRPNKFSHAVVLSNYSSYGLIDPDPSTMLQEPRLTSPISSSYKPISRPQRFTLDNLSGSISEHRPQVQKKGEFGDRASVTTSPTTKAQIHRSNSVVTQIFAPHEPTTLPPPSIPHETLPEDIPVSDFARQTQPSEKRRIHRRNESIATQTYAPPKPTEPPPEALSSLTTEGDQKPVETRNTSQHLDVARGERSRNGNDVPKSWVSFGEGGSRYWKSLPEEPPLRTYPPPKSARVDLNTKSSPPAREILKRDSNESASTASTSFSIPQHYTPDTSPSATSVSLTLRKRTPVSPRPSRIPIPSPRQTSVPQKAHRRISSQLSDDFRAIDDLTMESLLRPLTSDQDRSQGFDLNREDREVQEEQWRYPASGPEIFCTPPKAKPQDFPVPGKMPMSRRLSFGIRPQAMARLPSEVSFSGFSDGSTDTRDGNREEDEAQPPPISLRREDRMSPKGSEKRSRTLSLTGFMSGRKHQSSGFTRRSSSASRPQQISRGPLLSDKPQSPPAKGNPIETGVPPSTQNEASNPRFSGWADQPLVTVINHGLPERQSSVDERQGADLTSLTKKATDERSGTRGEPGRSANGIKSWRIERLRQKVEKKMGISLV